MEQTTPYFAAIRRYLDRTGYRKVAPRAALIDMDGTLYDSMPGHTAAWYRMITELGAAATRDEFYLYEGMTGADTINLIFNRAFGRNATKAETEEYYRRKTEYFRSGYKAEVMPGAPVMVQALKDMGIRCVLVTGSGQMSLIERVNRDFPGIFGEGMFVTSRDVVHGKPDPEPFKRGMEKARVQPWESIIVENAPLGVKAGNSSGAFTVAVTTGPIPREAFEEAGADIIFPSMEEFSRSITGLVMAMRQNQTIL